MFTTVGSRSRRSTLLLIISFLQLAFCQQNKDPPTYCPPSSCGEIHGITYPFRLDTDPPNCGFSFFPGDKNFTLSCHNNSSLFWYINNNKNPVGGRFLVKGINYDNFTIHLVDPGIQQNNCSSLPISPISSALYSNPYYTTLIRWKLEEPVGLQFFVFSRDAVLISCDRKQQVYNNNYYSVEFTAPCNKSKISKKYSYVILGDRESLQREMESCSINMITLLPSTYRFTYDDYYRITYQQIHTQLSYGFHVSWFTVLCQPKCSDYELCFLDEANRPTCFNSNGDHEEVIIKTWFIRDIYSYHLTRWYWDPIYKITGWLINIFILLGKRLILSFLFFFHKL